MVVYEAKSGALCVAIPVMLMTPGVHWSGKATVTLGKSNGEIQEKNIASLRKVFPAWDGSDPFALESIELAPEGQPEFDVVGEIEPYQPEPTETDPDPAPVDTFKIQWVNPLGSSARMPEKVSDQSKVLSKWGQKFRAVASGKAAPAVTAPKAAPAKAAPAKAPAPPAAAAPAPRGRAAAPAAPVAARTSTAEDAWANWAKATASMDADERTNKFYDAQDAVVGNDQHGGELTPEQWGAVEAHLGV